MVFFWRMFIGSDSTLWEQEGTAQKPCSTPSRGTLGSGSRALDLRGQWQPPQPPKQEPEHRT